MTKRKSIIIYTVYASLLIFIILFGGSLSRLFHDVLFSVTHDGKITDVEVDLEESYVVDAWHKPKYTAKGDFGDNPRLVFQALDDNIQVSWSSGEFKGKRTDSDKTTARIKITSTFDKSFEKIISVNLEKRHPENFGARYATKSLGYTAGYAFVGIPVLPYVNIEKDVVYSEKDFVSIYDPEYFRKGEGDELIPIKPTPPGEKVTVTLVMPNGATDTTAPFEIREAPRELADFDTISLYKMWDYPEAVIGNGYFIELIKDGERVYSDYELEIDGEAVILGERYVLIYKKAGDAKITVTLPNGFSKSMVVTVENHLEIPKISGLSENDTFTAAERVDTVFPIEYDYHSAYKELSLEYNSKKISAWVYGNSIVVKGIKPGVHDLTLVLDDGTKRLEKTYKVAVEKGVSVWDILVHDTSYFVSKFIGHLFGFGILALFSLNMFRFIGKKRRLILLLLDYSGCALCIAGLTEFAQLFMEGRTGSFDDIVIDMLSYYLGTVLVLAAAGISLIIRRIKKRHVYVNRRLKKKALKQPGNRNS